MVQSKFTKPIILFTTLSLSTAIGACAPTTGLSPNATPVSAQGQSPEAIENGSSAAPEKAFNRFPDLPIPTNVEMDSTRTQIYGSGETWYGQLGLNTGHGSDSMFDFYKQELKGFGWQEITSVRALVSVLTYERKGRILSIQIEQTSKLTRKAKVTISVSPRAGAAAVIN
ncbi:MAG: hypothetical protein OQK24_09980 [Magnetovibrio sp.]|nr:hypothetical protein [Magnetovibrio sp.]